MHPPHTARFTITVDGKQYEVYRYHYPLGGTYFVVHGTTFERYTLVKDGSWRIAERDLPELAGKIGVEIEKWETTEPNEQNT